VLGHNAPIDCGHVLMPSSHVNNSASKSCVCGKSDVK